MVSGAYNHLRILRLYLFLLHLAKAAEADGRGDFLHWVIAWVLEDFLRLRSESKFDALLFFEKIFCWKEPI